MQDWRKAGVGDSYEAWGQDFGTSFGFSKGTYCVRISRGERDGGAATHRWHRGSEERVHCISSGKCLVGFKWLLG